MPLFEYTARNAANGQIQKGQVEVKSREEVSAYLRKNRMMLVSVREAPKKISLGGSLGKARVKTRDIVIFTRQFATMINAGLPLVQSLTILAEQTENKTLQEVTKAVVHDVEAGNTLADAFSKHPKAFSGLYVNMVAAGEAGGILDTILIRLATFLEKSDALIRDDKVHQIYSAMQAGKKFGMQTMNDALYQLYTAREVAQEECERVSHDPKEFLRMIGVTPMEDQDMGTTDRPQQQKSAGLRR